jgi:glycosyltransferase involved in cell wall biosynthesis
VWGAAALYVAADDHEALHAALAQLIDDPARCRACAGAARGRALAFSTERMVGAYLAAYGRISPRFASASHSSERLEELACAS